MDINDSQRIKQIRDNTEKMADAFTRIADALERLADRKTENSSEKPNNSQTCANCKFDHEEWFEEACDSCCDAHSNWQPKTEPTTEDCSMVEDEPQTKLCRECDDYAGNGMYCAQNHIVYDFSISNGNCEPQTERSE